MPVPDDIKERVANNIQQLNYYYQLQQYGRTPEEYKSYDVDTNKPVFDVYKNFDINSRVPTITGEYGWAGSPGQIKMSSFQVPRIMSSDLKKRVKNDQELRRYLRHVSEICQIPKEYANYDDDYRPLFDINKYYVVQSYQDLQEP